MKITNEIKSIVFHQYHGQYVDSDKGRCRLRDSDFIDTLNWIVLKPVSVITDEDAIELYESKSFPNLHRKAPDEQLKEWGHNEEAIKKIKSDTVRSCIKSIWQDFPLFLCDFLRSKGYDVPHYLLDGKTLKEAGLAKYENENGK